MLRLAAGIALAVVASGPSLVAGSEPIFEGAGMITYESAAASCEMTLVVALAEAGAEGEAALAYAMAPSASSPESAVCEVESALFTAFLNPPAMVARGDWSAGWRAGGLLNQMTIGPYGDGSAIDVRGCLACALSGGYVSFRGSISDLRLV